MSPRQTPPPGPYLVRTPGALYMTAEYPSTDNGRVAFMGSRVRYDDERLGHQVRSYVITSDPEWQDLDGRGCSITTPRLQVPAEFADGLKVAA